MSPKPNPTTPLQNRHQNVPHRRESEKNPTVTPTKITAAINKRSKLASCGPQYREARSPATPEDAKSNTVKSAGNILHAGCAATRQNATLGFVYLSVFCGTFTTAFGS